MAVLVYYDGLSYVSVNYASYLICICHVLFGFSCWASAHGCSVWQVVARTESTNHEYGEREATRTCLACPTALVGGLFENGCNNL